MRGEHIRLNVTIAKKLYVATASTIMTALMDHQRLHRQRSQLLGSQMFSPKVYLTHENYTTMKPELIHICATDIDMEVVVLK